MKRYHIVVSLCFSTLFLTIILYSLLDTTPIVTAQTFNSDNQIVSPKIEPVETVTSRGVTVTVPILFEEGTHLAGINSLPSAAQLLQMRANDNGRNSVTPLLPPDTVLPPSICPDSSTYSRPVQVTLLTFPDDADIHYTVDNSDPTQASTLYTAPFVISSSLTLKAKGYKTGLTESSTSTSVYTFSLTNNFSFTLDIADNSYPGNGRPGWSASGDLNDDGLVDIVSGGGLAIQWYEAPNWTRHAIETSSTIGGNGGIVADVDGDGYLDIITARYLSHLVWFRNPGPGNYTNPWTRYTIDATSPQGFNHDLAYGDIDGDMENEIVALYVASGGIAWYDVPADPVNNAWPKTQILTTINDPFVGLALGDIDDDNDIDVVAANKWYENPANPSTPNWTERTILPFAVQNIMTYDVNGDNNLDVVAAEGFGYPNGRLLWIEAPADPLTQPWTQHLISNTLDGPENIWAGDLDGDGDTDIVSAEMGTSTGYNDNDSNFLVFEGQNTSGTSWQTHIIAQNVGVSARINPVDIDGDGDVDFTADGNAENHIYLWLNQDIITLPCNPPNAPPEADIWYGTQQQFGHLGLPQQWINILGNVTSTVGISSASYSLNGNPALPLSVGPDTRRLADPGDINVEIDYTDLVSGANQLLITATDSLNAIITEVVTISYTDGVIWSLPYSIDWSSISNIQDAVQVVDGLWITTSGGLRTSQVDYDRVIAIGDLTWSDYEVTVPITVHAIDPGGYQFPSISPGFGLTTRWSGHTNNPVVCGQPRCGWLPSGAGSWYDIGMNGPLSLDGTPDNSVTINIGDTYYWKMRVETVAGTGTQYYVKVWELGQPEPAAWNITTQRGLSDEQNGSLLFIAHHVDLTIGDIEVVEAIPVTHTLTINTVGTGSVQKVPDKTVYNQGESVDLTAVPAPGWQFVNWSGDLTGNTNPETLVMTADRVVTATFISDVTPPVISDIHAAPDNTQAIITWSTSEPATSTVSFGTTNAYGTAISDATLTTNHTVVLTGLISETLYHYQVQSADNGGNTAVSGNLTFTLRTYGDGPGGIGTTIGGSYLEIWYKADNGVFTDSSCSSPASGTNSVACWLDSSGNNHHAVAPTGAEPVYQASRPVINNRPIIEFNGSNQRFITTDTVRLFATPNAGVTAFTIFDTDDNNSQRFLLNMTTAICNNFELGYDTGLDAFTPARGNFGLHRGQNDATVAPDNTINNNSFGILTTIVQTTNTAPNNVNYFQNGTVRTAATDNGSCPGVGWLSANNYPAVNQFIDIGARNDQGVPGYNSFHDGDIAEIIVFNSNINNARRTIIENYLTAKYDIPISNQRYGPTTYTLSVTGIGAEANGKHITAVSDGLQIDERNNSLAIGEYVMTGHQTPVNGNQTGDVPAAVDQRWERVWRIEKTGTANVQLTFDFSEGGMTGSAGDPANYVLLFSATNAFSWTQKIVGATTVSGDRVSFIVNDAELEDGYYTLATQDANISPTAVSLNALFAQNRTNNNAPVLFLVIVLLASLSLRVIKRQKQFFR